MSSEDEALMWDILDLASSSSPLEATEASAPAPTRKKRKTTKQPAGKSIRQSDFRERDLENTPTPSVPSDANPVIDGLGGPMLNDESISDWQFPDRTGSNAPGSLVPDIPDWMIFGDFMSEHL